MSYKIEFYSKKSPLRRRQYHWRIRHDNGRIIARSSEGYNNSKECGEIFWNMRRGLAREGYEIDYQW